MNETEKLIKLGTINIVDDNDVYEIIDVTETVDLPIVDKLYDLGFELEEDDGYVEVSRDGIALVVYKIYVIKSEVFIGIKTMSDTPLSSQAVQSIKNSIIKFK